MQDDKAKVTEQELIEEFRSLGIIEEDIIIIDFENTSEVSNMLIDLFDAIPKRMSELWKLSYDEQASSSAMLLCASKFIGSTMWDLTFGT